MKEDKEVKVDLSFFFFLFLKQEISENVFPFYGLHFRD